jgi:SusD/RagB-like outer membrane lipoprotein
MRYQILSVLAAALVASTACSDLTSINQNPNGTPDAPPPAILSNALQNAIGNSQTGQGVLNIGLNVNAGGLWAQHYAEIQYRDEDKYIVRPGTDDAWRFYSGPLEDFQRMIDKGVAGDAPNWAAVGRIMKSYLFGVMTEAMGDIPYSEALKGVSVLTPTYDSQRDIYTALFADLAKAGQEIDTAKRATGFPSGDLMYGGVMIKWRKFANALRLRLAIHVSNADSATAHAQAQAAVAAGLFQSNADNAQLTYQAASPNQNPIYENALTRDDYGMSKTFVDSLLSWSDPRLPVFAQLNKDSVPKYQGMPNGLNDGEGPLLSSISRFGGYWRSTPNATMPILTYSEVLFLEAEAAQRGWIAGDPATLYNDAIRASMAQYGVTDSAVTAYLAQPRVLYAPATGLTQIAYQKWVSLYMNGIEAWTEVRRTLVPTLTPGPRAVLSRIPERLPYDDNEQVLNSANVDAAVAAQGFGSSTNLSTPLWFTGRQP